MDGAVGEDENGDGAESEIKAAADEEDAMVKVEDGGFEAEGGEVVDDFYGEEGLIGFLAVRL